MTTTERSRRRALATALTAPLLAIALVVGVPGPVLGVVPADYSNVSISLTPFMTGLDGPVQVTNAADGSKSPVRRRAARRHQGLAGRARPVDVPRHADEGRVQQRAGPPRARVPPELREQPQVLRPVHRERHRRRHRRRVQGKHDEPEQGVDVLVPATAPDRPPGQHEPQRRDACVRDEGLSLHLGWRRWRRRRRPEQRAVPQDAPRQDPADRRQRHVRLQGVPDPARQPLLQEHLLEAGDLVARPAQPVALLVRPLHRRPVDRRRRPGQLGGGRPRHADRRPGRQRRELRLARHGRQRLLQPVVRL